MRTVPKNLIPGSQHLSWLLIAAALALVVSPVSANNDAVADLTTRLDALQDSSTAQLAPVSYAAARDAVDQLSQRIARGHAADIIERQRRNAQEQVQAAEGAVARVQERYAAMLSARQAAAAANAEAADSRTWRQAERDFERALDSLDRGRESFADRMAAQAEQNYDEAELTAIAAGLFTEARAMIEQAERERVERHAPQRLAAARETLATAEAALEHDRYNTEGPRLLAQQAREQASHAR
jgi:OmpA-OmpF porin, OOP family